MKSYQARFADKAKALNTTLGNLDKIGAGVSERFNWQLLHEYVNFASPQPNGDKLADRSVPGVLVKDTYWTKDSKKAFELMEKKRLGIMDNLPAAEMQKNDLFMKKHLVQINIAGINALYCEDLPAFFRKLSKDGNDLTGMDGEDRKKVVAVLNEADQAKRVLLLEGPTEGWVIEIRGYTYRDKAIQFVTDTIIENLKFPGNLKDKYGKEFVMPPGMKDLVEKRVGFLNLYQRLEVKDPVAGEFRLINRSFLRDLVKGLPPEVGPGGLAPPPPPPPPGAAVKPNRDAWRPIGDTASFVLGAGGGPGVFAPPQFFPPPVNPKEKDVVAPKVIPRTEFVLVFVWREPITAHAPVGLPGQPPVVPPPPPPPPPPGKG